jgi:hypothetical protein
VIRRSSAALVALVLMLVGAVGLAGVPSARAQQAPDKSDVVILLDFSASILQDKANRQRFATALDRIADRVDAISPDLEAGDGTLSLVQFAARARDYPGCTDLKTLGSPRNVAKFADCLRGVAGAYRKGLDPNLRQRIGVDTNYVAAMESAARHLPKDSARPAAVLLTDGKHDVAGVPVSRVRPARDRLFGDQSPFALLPVGMGLKAGERGELKRGLDALKVIRDMPACVSGSTFDWPQTTFNSAASAGNAVALALQNVTCTFTVAPTPTPPPTPTPTPVPLPGQVRNIAVVAGNGEIRLTWQAPVAGPVDVVDYVARCRTGEGDWIESTEGTSTTTNAAITGVDNGAPYECQVAAIGSASPEGRFTEASVTVTPIGRPSAPDKPTGSVFGGGVRVAVGASPAPGVAEYRYECSSDGGATWPVTVTSHATDTSAEVTGLANGTEYVCRAFATNASGVSDASAVSDALRPCGSAIECTPIIMPVLIAAGAVLGLVLLILLFALYRGRPRDYVVAVVDVVHTRNLGHGSAFAIAVKPEGIDKVRGGRSDVRIQYLGKERFRVFDRGDRKQEATAGIPLRVVDGRGTSHELVLWAFATPSAAAAEASRR